MKTSSHQKQPPEPLYLLNQKVGVFYNKDKKVLQLQTSNKQLQLQIQKEMQIFYSLSNKLAEVDTQRKKLQTENSFMQIQSMMLKQSIQSLNKKIQIYEPEILCLADRIKQKEDQYVKEQELFKKVLQKNTQSKNTLLRFKEQQKVQKMMIKSQRNIVKIHQSTKKSTQNYKKNIEILENKLQGKKRYFLILKKKYQKLSLQKQKKQKEKQKERQEYRNTLSQSNKRYSVQNLKSYHNVKNEEIGDKVDKKPNMKEFNELTRKKNAILMKKK